MQVLNQRILIVDNEPLVRKILATRLTTKGYKIILATNGIEALNLFICENPDLIILDIVLPKLDGYEVCRRIREKSKVPIIILTSRASITDRIMGLDLGANDYIIKPFSPKELEARIRSNLRHFNKSELSPTNLNVSYIKNLIMDFSTKTVLKEGNKVGLTIVEFNVLKFLIQEPGKELSRKNIMNTVWGYTPERDVDTRIVDVYISRLRSKLEDNPNKPDLILTIRGIGYMFNKY